MGFLNKFPSFNFIYKNAVATFVRFPFTILSAVLGAVVGIMLVESDKQFQEYVLQKMGMIAALGLPLFTALAFYADKKLWDKTKSYGLQAVGLLLLVIYYFSLPENPENPEYHLQRFMLLNISFHFLVAFIPFIGGNQVQGFWQFNKSLFLRFLTAALYSSVLYIGLAIALLALDYLFGVDIIWKSYMKLWIVIASVFNTWFFLTGVPADLNDLNNTQEYPKGLKVFTQYILLPLVALYFLILITYEFKIIFEWNLPKGWVSQLVLWFSVVGILSLLLLHPLRERTESKWIKVFSKWFFRMLLPLLGMLFVAIWVRIADYGMTENRYYVMAMAIGLALVVCYFIFSKAKDIRIIPIVVFAIAILSAFGPWGAFAVSKASQSNRMEAILIEHSMLIDGRIVVAEEELPIKTRKDLSSITRYLADIHGIESLARWFDDSTLAALDSFTSNYQSEELTKLMGFEYISKYAMTNFGKFYRFRSDEMLGYNLGNYDYIIRLNMIEDPPGPFKLDEDELFINRAADKSGLAFKFNSNEKNIEDSIFVDLTEPLLELISDGKIGRVPSNEISFEQSGDYFDLKLIFESINIHKTKETLELNDYKGIVLVRVK